MTRSYGWRHDPLPHPADGNMIRSRNPRMAT
jgi:hypothetical protein